MVRVTRRETTPPTAPCQVVHGPAPPEQIADQGLALGTRAPSRYGEANCFVFVNFDLKKYSSRNLQIQFP